MATIKAVATIVGVVLIIAGAFTLAVGIFTATNAAGPHSLSYLPPLTNSVKPSSSPGSNSTKPRPVSAHNLYAKNQDFLKDLDDECRDDNPDVVQKGYNVGMWAFSGPDSHGHIHVWCKGYYLHGTQKVWWDAIDVKEADDYVLVH